MYIDFEVEFYKVLGMKSNLNYGDNVKSKFIFYFFR